LKYDWLRKEFMKVTGQCGVPEITAPKTLRHTFATCLQDANVDPLIRNELMGHAPTSFGANGCGLGMTAVYTHTRPETKRCQLEDAMQSRPVISLADSFVADVG
jgi:site-specific recombinase XerD